MRRMYIWLFSAILISVFVLFLLVIRVPSTKESRHRLRNGVVPMSNPGSGSIDSPKGESKSKAPIKWRKDTQRVHVFYYNWYENPESDAVVGWNHWNHNILPHWSKETRERYKHNVRYEPPGDIGSCFYPARGPYSSSSRETMFAHMRELADYVVVVTWWGRGGKDGEGMDTDALMARLFDVAEETGTMLAFHVEPYQGRTARTVLDDIKYIIDKYGDSPAFYRDPARGNRPVVYLYDSYQTPSSEWRQLLSPDGSMTIRNTKYDIVALGLWVEQGHQSFIEQGAFDGFYTYFAADGFVYGSTSRNWASMVTWATSKNLISSISVGPGYDDTRIRPCPLAAHLLSLIPADAWSYGHLGNFHNTKSRSNGQYYDQHWQTAIDTKPTYISITSYNEWMEGTQIEAVQPKKLDKTIYDGQPYTYQDYGALAENFYMDKTNQWTARFLGHEN